MGVEIPDILLQHIKEECARIHHGQIRIEINADKRDKIDVITESRERFSAK